MFPAMTDDTETKSSAPSDSGERIAKRIARAGVASRREAERLVDAGRVTVNGEVIRSPAVDVGPDDAIAIDGTPVPKPERTRLWRYHKPAGLLVSRTDPRGRRTIYMELPAELGHAISVGRLDFNSEGLLLLTNDGELSRKLELPTAGLVRRYRARAFGHIDQKALDRLKNGITVDGVRYGPIDARLEEARGANAWIALSLAEGKNREVRNVLRAVGLHVNRLIRTHYGPFALGDMPPGAVAEVPAASLMRDLGVATERPKGWAKAKPKLKARPKLKQRPGKNARLAARKPHERENARDNERREQRQEHRPGDRRPSGNLQRSAKRPGDSRRDDGRPEQGRRVDERSSPRSGERASAGPDSRKGTSRNDDRRFAGARGDRPGSKNAERRDQHPTRQAEHRPGDRRPSGNPHRETAGDRPPQRAGDMPRIEKRPWKVRDERRPERPRGNEERRSENRSPRRDERGNDNRTGGPERRDGKPHNDNRPPRRDEQRSRPSGEQSDRPARGDRPQGERPRDDRGQNRDQGRGGNRNGPRKSFGKGPGRGPRADRRR
jgi:23S rRNA pseudouridine2605 synthase